MMLTNRVPEENRNVRCHVCGKDKAYYEKTGKDYALRCLHCGHMTSGSSETSPYAVLEMIYLDGTIDIVVYHQKVTPRCIKRQLLAYAPALKSAELRVNGIDGTVSWDLNKMTWIRAATARIVTLYEWLAKMVTTILEIALWQERRYKKTKKNP